MLSLYVDLGRVHVPVSIALLCPSVVLPSMVLWRSLSLIMSVRLL